MKTFLKKKNSGFSLVELIIVIAIMVALVAVMAPSMTKYIKKARDQAIRGAAEECIAFVKAEFGLTLTGEGAIRVGAERSTKNLITLKFVPDEKNGGANNICYKNESGDEGIEAFKTDVGFKDGVVTQSDLAFLIRVRADDVSSHPELELIVEETRVNDDD